MQCIGHRLTDRTKGKVRVCGGGFLFPEEESRFRWILEIHARSFAFSPNEIGCVDHTIVEMMVIQGLSYGNVDYIHKINEPGVV